MGQEASRRPPCSPRIPGSRSILDINEIVVLARWLNEPISFPVQPIEATAGSPFFKEETEAQRDPVTCLG